MQCLADLSLLLSLCLLHLSLCVFSCAYDTAAIDDLCIFHKMSAKESNFSSDQEAAALPPSPSLRQDRETKAAFKGSGMEICIECVAYFRAERWNCFQLTHTLEHACTALSRIYLEPTTQAAGSSIPRTPPPHCLLLISPPFLTALRCKNFVCCLILCCEAKVQLNYEFQFYFRANNNNNWATITS